MKKAFSMVLALGLCLYVSRNAVAADEIVRPENVPVAEESVINAKSWSDLFPTASTFTDGDTSFTLPYRLHSPAVVEGVKYPLVVFLHGAGESGTDNAKQVQTANDVIPITKYAMKHGDAFVLAPQCPGASGSDYSLTWSGADWNRCPMTRLETPTQPMAAVMKLVADFIANHPVDPTRIYVTGLSMGGFGTWDLASRMTDTFAAVMPCCGGADPNAAELYEGQSIRFFHGSSDNVVSPAFSSGMDAALTAAGIDHDYIVYSGCNHVDCWRKAYVDTEDNLEWMFGHIQGEAYVAPDHGDTTPNADISTLQNGWVGWKMNKAGTTVVSEGTKVWAYAQNYSCRQGHFGANLVVNGVEFTKSGSFVDMSSNISCDKTFGYGRDNFGTENLNDGEDDFGRMMKTGWEATGDQGPSQTYTLHGLTAGKMYLIQFIYHCASTDRAMLSVLAPDNTTSTRVNGWDANGQILDENWRYGGSLIGIFTADGTEKSFTLTYSRTANYMLNAVQLREVTRGEIVYGTPTIGSVVPSVSGTTATLSLSNVAAGENGGCYQVWLAVAEDGVALGDEAVVMYSQQAASCAVEIPNLTAGKKYNYSLYVKNEGNMASEAKTGCFTVPGGENEDDDDPNLPPVGWTAIPMTSDGSVFSTDGALVFAFARDRGDPGTTYVNSSGSVPFNYLNTLTDTVTKYHPWQHGGEAIDGPYGDGRQPADFVATSPVFTGAKDNCGDEGLGGDMAGFGSMLMCAWQGPTLDASGEAIFTVKGLSPGNKYLVEFFIHGSGEAKTITAPDGVATVTYGGTGWSYGGLLRGAFVATGETQDFTLTYSDPGSFRMNAIQLRDLGEVPDDEPAEADPDTSWMAGSFGVSFHWTAKIVTQYGPMTWEQAVNNFDVEAFADSVESYGAQHVIFTTAHAWQQLPCPCVALDDLISGRTTQRDLLKDIIDALTNRNIRVVFYYNHSCNHDEDQPWDVASGYDAITDAQSMTNFANNVCSIVRELSLRYGDGVSAWWFDSAPSIDDSLPWTGNKKAENVNGLSFPWDNLFAAARAGNPHAAVAVNWDVHAVDQHDLPTDYLSGETEKIDAYGNFFPFAPDGFQDHIWTRMDSSDWFWQGGEVSTYGSRFTEEQLAWWRASHRAAGRMATLNLVIDESGAINPVVAQQLVNTKTPGKVWVQGRYAPTTWQAAPAVSNLLLLATGGHAGDRSPYSDGYHRTPITVLTDGTVPMGEIVAGAGLTNDEKSKIFESLEGNVFTWTLAQSSDVYGLNLYSRSSRSQHNGAMDGGNDALVVTKVEVLPSGASEWVDIQAPALSFGKSDGISGGALVAKLMDGTGAPLATGVTAIRFTQGAPENGASLLVECEVLGCAASSSQGTIAEEAAKLGLGCWLAMPLTGDPEQDVITNGVLAKTTVSGRSKDLSGAKKYGTYHTVSFGGSWSGDGGMTSLPEVKNNKGDVSNCGVEGAYGELLAKAWNDNAGTAAEHQTFLFQGLDAGKTYLVQYILHGGASDDTATVTDSFGPKTAYLKAADSSDSWYYGGTLVHVFKPAQDGTYSLTVDYRNANGEPSNGFVNAFQVREIDERAEPDPIPVYMLTIPAKEGLDLESVTTNGTAVAAVEGVYPVVSGTEVTITFAAANGYELTGSGTVVLTVDGDLTLPAARYPGVRPVVPVYTLTIPAKEGLVLESVTTNGTAVAAVDGAYSVFANATVTISFAASGGYEITGGNPVVKTISGDTTLADADYPAVRAKQGGDDPDPRPGELVNGRANMKGWAMKRISTASKVASETGFGWSAADNPSSKSYSASESVMVFNEAQAVNTIQLFAPKSENNGIPQPVGQMPSAFKVFGSNDGSAWTTLLSIADEADWLSMECRYYTFSNETAYAQYKFSVESTVGGGAAKLGVYNYYRAKPADPATPWVYANNKLTRGDQEINVWKDGQTLKVSGSVAEGAVYDLDFTAGIVDGEGSALAYTFNLEQKFQNNKDLTRLIGGNVVSRINGWGCQNCWYLNEVSLGEAFTAFADRQAFENNYSLEWLDMESTPVETLPSNTFACSYNLKGDLVLHVKTFSSKFNGSRLTSIRLDEVVTYGDNNYFAPFEGCTFLTNITLGANLTTINCKQAFGKIPVPVSLHWNSAPPEFTQDAPDVFNDKGFVKHMVTSYLPLDKRAEWETFADSVTKFKLDLPTTDDGEGTWYTGSSFEQYVRWLAAAPDPVPFKGTIIYLR